MTPPNEGGATPPEGTESGGRESSLTYRGYRIDYDPPPIPYRGCDWQFAHEDYGGPEDTRCGHAASPEACMAEIDMIEDDQ